MKKSEIVSACNHRTWFVSIQTPEFFVDSTLSPGGF